MYAVTLPSAKHGLTTKNKLLETKDLNATSGKKKKHKQWYYERSTHSRDQIKRKEIDVKCLLKISQHLSATMFYQSCYKGTIGSTVEFLIL